MPITPFLKDSNFTPDLTRVVKVAFEMTCTALKFPRNDNPVVTRAAKRIVELAKGGEHNPDALCEHEKSLAGAGVEKKEWRVIKHYCRARGLLSLL
jgi:hypothetical protein